MQSSDNTLNYNAHTYGFDVQGTSSMDTHLLKNTEWGIVAMLSHSKYGKYGNSSYLGVNKEIYQNKAEGYVTGMSNGTPSQELALTQVTYDTPNTGYGASTTGTIYGVYDMSGGAFKFVMGGYDKYSGRLSSNNSGFCGKLKDGTDFILDCVNWPDDKYVDVYTPDNGSISYKFGDAIYETGGWYNDSWVYPNYTNIWYHRGGNITFVAPKTAGIFSSSAGSGGSSSIIGSRFAVKP